MDPLRTSVTYVSPGTDDDKRIFKSMINTAQIDLNSRFNQQVMFTTPNEGFQTRNTTTLGLVAILLVLLLVIYRS